MKIAQRCAVDFTLYHFLLPLMQGLRAQGHEVVGICGDGALLPGVRDHGFRVETIPFARSLSPRRNLAAFRQLRTLFRRERFDMVHVHTPVAAAVGRFAAAATGVPKVVYTAHGFYFHEHTPNPKRAAFIAMEWVAGRFTDTLFTQAAEDAATAKRLALCRTGDVLPIGNGSDPALFHPDSGARQQIRAALQTDPDRIVIAAVGRLVAEKGFPELVDAMRHVDAELWLVGERLASDHAAALNGVFKAVETDPVLRRRVRLLGYRTDIPGLLAAADIFTLPSHREGMPRSVIEAMLTGLPVVATDIRGTREEVVDNQTGYLVPVKNKGPLAAALNRLVADANLRQTMGMAGRARALAEFDEALVIARQIDHLGLAAANPATPANQRDQRTS
ncbi:MAG: glycosyltransferase family 4 protein [Alphaproteobacteria bacterium]